MIVKPDKTLEVSAKLPTEGIVQRLSVALCPSQGHVEKVYQNALQEGPVRVDQTGKAIAAGLQLPWLALLHHNDRGLVHDMLGRRGLDLREVGRLRGWNLSRGVLVLRVRKAIPDEQSGNYTQNGSHGRSPLSGASRSYMFQGDEYITISFVPAVFPLRLSQSLPQTSPRTDLP